MMMTD